MELSFNPCYAGSKIESTIKELKTIIRHRFNPCYAGSKIESNDRINTARTELEFQSLLCWK